MAVGTADLYKAINTAWDASGINATFRALWALGVVPGEFLVLNDQEAIAEQPFPYVVMDEVGSEDIANMSFGTDSKMEIRDVEVRFNVQARIVEGDSRTSKEIAAFLVEEIMKVFGGHPTVRPTEAIELDNGDHLITQFVNDFAIRTGDDEYQWIVQYLFRLDIPVKI